MRSYSVLIFLAFTFLASPLTVHAQEATSPPYIRTAHTFLLAWGQQRWDELRDVAAGQVSVKLGTRVFTLEPATHAAEVRLVFPFRGLSTVRANGKVTGVTLEEIGLKVEDIETRGPADISLIEDNGEFRVIGVSVGATR